MAIQAKFVRGRSVRDRVRNEERRAFLLQPRRARRGETARTPCNLFLKAKGCRFGDRCRFSHTDPAASLAPGMAGAGIPSSSSASGMTSAFDQRHVNRTRSAASSSVSLCVAKKKRLSIQDIPIGEEEAAWYARAVSTSEEGQTELYWYTKEDNVESEEDEISDEVFE